MAYKSLAYFYDDLMTDEIYNIYFSLLKKHKKTGRVLDIGCGTGKLGILLSKNNYQVVCCDLSEDMLDIASNNAMIESVSINFFIYNFSNTIPYEYDIILASTDVINHLENEEQTIKAIKNTYEALKSNGVFIFDFLKISYIDSLLGHNEEIEDKNIFYKWDAVKGMYPFSILHKIKTLDSYEEIIERTYSKDFYLDVLSNQGFKLVELIELDERIILVLKK